MSTTTRSDPAGPVVLPTTVATSAPTAHERLVLAVVCLATVLVIGCVAAVNLAAPDLARSGLHLSASQLLWVVDLYVILFACLVIPGGAAGDRLGRKGVLTAGLGAVAGNLGGGALLAVGGWRWLLAVGGWRWLLAAVAPAAAACAALIAVVAPRSGRHGHRLDLPGAATLTLAVFAALAGIIEGPSRGWSSWFVLTCWVVSVIAAVSWVRVERGSPRPLLDPALFRIPALRAACLGMLVVFFGLFGLFYLNASVLQIGRGYGVLLTGVAILPLTLPLVLLARRVPALVTRIGYRAVLTTAFVLTGVGLGGLAATVTAGYGWYAVGLVVTGLGVTLALPALTIAITSALPASQAGIGGGLQSTTRELGSALGVAVVGSVLASRLPRTGPAGPLAAAQSGHATAVALVVAGAVVLVAGALVVAEMTLAARYARPAARRGGAR